jgi:hypothetical protein
MRQITNLESIILLIVGVISTMCVMMSCGPSEEEKRAQRKYEEAHNPSKTVTTIPRGKVGTFAINGFIDAHVIVYGSDTVMIIVSNHSTIGTSTIKLSD